MDVVHLLWICCLVPGRVTRQLTDQSVDITATLASNLRTKNKYIPLLVKRVSGHNLLPNVKVINALVNVNKTRNILY